jgi:hypothetical protein
MATFYKGEKHLNVVKTINLDFSTQTNFSEPAQISNQKGLSLDYCGNREVLYVFPMSSQGINEKRWWSIEEQDIPQLIEALKEINEI